MYHILWQWSYSIPQEAEPSEVMAQYHTQPSHRTAAVALKPSEMSEMKDEIEKLVK